MEEEWRNITANAGILGRKRCFNNAALVLKDACMSSAGLGCVRGIRVRNDLDWEAYGN
jgi:hypothetical protein